MNVLEIVKDYLKTLTDKERIEFIEECMIPYCERCGRKEIMLACFCDPIYDEGAIR